MPMLPADIQFERCETPLGAWRADVSTANGRQMLAFGLIEEIQRNSPQLANTVEQFAPAGSRAWQSGNAMKDWRLVAASACGPPPPGARGISGIAGVERVTGKPRPWAGRATAKRKPTSVA